MYPLTTTQMRALQEQFYVSETTLEMQGEHPHRMSRATLRRQIHLRPARRDLLIGPL